MKSSHEKALAKFKSAKAAHHASGPHKSAKDAIESPTFSAVHKARKELKNRYGS
jgi:hypothetical protein